MTVAEITTSIQSNNDNIKAIKMSIKTNQDEIIENHEKRIAAKSDEELALLSVTRDKLHSKQTSLEQTLEYLNVRGKVLKQNRLAAIYKEIIPVLVEEFNKYKGKPYGEKTRRKIADAIYKRTNFYAHIDSRMNTRYNVYGIERLDLYLSGDNIALNRENKIEAVSEDMFRIHYKEVDPDITTAEILRRLSKAREAFSEYRKAEAELNAISPEHIYASEPAFYNVTR